jgi:DNA (cytosine-5)-methyltransferase 1
MTHKYKVLDLFSGAGGLSLGFKKSGFEIIGAVDKDNDSIKTHNYNFNTCKSICRDIKTIKKEEALNLFKYTDIIIGGPPCQGFSSANMWQKDMNDERNKLFFQFIKFVNYLKPKVVLIENVQGILSKNNGYARKKIYEILENQGYNVNSKVLLASDYGVPQKRKRAFFIGFKKDINVDFEFERIPKKTEVTVKEAISDLYDLENNRSSISKTKSSYQALMRKNSNGNIKNHKITYPKDKIQERMEYVPQGGNWRHVPENLWDTVRNNRHSSAYRRLKENEPSVTIDTGHMNYFHPLYNRVPTVRESARLQSFPDDFIFLGSKTSQFRQVGNAVPPLISEALATQIKKYLEDNNV